MYADQYLCLGRLFARSSAVFLAAAATGWTRSPNSWVLPNFAQRLEVVVSNPFALPVRALAVVPVVKAAAVAPRFPGSLATAVLVNPPGSWFAVSIIHSQADDPDGDGAPDEFVFPVELGPASPARHVSTAPPRCITASPGRNGSTPSTTSDTTTPPPRSNRKRSAIACKATFSWTSRRAGTGWPGSTTTCGLLRLAHFLDGRHGYHPYRRYLGSGRDLPPRGWASVPASHERPRLRPQALPTRRSALSRNCRWTGAGPSGERHSPAACTLLRTAVSGSSCIGNL